MKIIFILIACHIYVKVSMQCFCWNFPCFVFIFDMFILLFYKQSTETYQVCKNVLFRCEEVIISLHFDQFPPIWHMYLSGMFFSVFSNLQSFLSVASHIPDLCIPYVFFLIFSVKKKKKNQKYSMQGASWFAYFLQAW